MVEQAKHVNKPEMKPEMKPEPKPESRISDEDINILQALETLERAVMAQCPSSEHTVDMHMHLGLAKVAYNRLQDELTEKEA